MKEKDKLEFMGDSYAHSDHKKLCFELSKGI